MTTITAYGDGRHTCVHRESGPHQMVRRCLFQIRFARKSAHRSSIVGTWRAQTREERVCAGGLTCAGRNTPSGRGAAAVRFRQAFRWKRLRPDRAGKIGWRRRRDSNPRDPFESNGFQDRRLRPLGHSSGSDCNSQRAAASDWKPGPSIGRHRRAVTAQFFIESVPTACQELRRKKQEPAATKRERASR